MCNNKFGQYVLLVLLTIFVSLEIKAILSPRIVNVYTSVEMVSNQTDESAVSPAVYTQTGSEIRPLEDITELIKQTFPEEPEIMVAIAKSESGQNLNPKAENLNRNGSKDCGVMQINSIHGYDCEWLKDPKNNLEVARKIYETQGKRAWVSFNTNNYKYNL